MSKKTKAALSSAPDEAGVGVATAAPDATPTAPRSRPVITVRERNAIIRSLGAGEVPEFGLEHLQVGRERETKALFSGLDIVKDDGGSFNIVTGTNGAGKTFQTRLLRSRAIQENFVVVSADLNVNHRLYATDGRARLLYSTLMANVFTKACPAGKGLRPLLETWISSLAFDAHGEAATPTAMAAKINQQLRALKDFPAGFDFATVLGKYYEGHVNDNPALQDAALRWIRAEFSTRTEARHELGVRRIISDEDFYGALKLFAAFSRLAGYSGLLVILDELSALTDRLSLARARQANTQVLLSIINECFQGGASGLGFVLAGVPESLTHPERGLFSVPAFRSRLRPCSTAGYLNPNSPVIQLAPLGRDELYVLLHNVRHVHALGDESKYRLADEALERFLDQAVVRMGRTVLANPRDILRPFVDVLEALESQPALRWEELIDQVLAAPAPDSAEGQLKNLQLK